MNEVVIKVIGNYSYQTSKCLGEGVYGKVYEGIERETKEKVAIKKIDLATFTNDKYLQNAIFSEIYLLKRFNHANIVKFKDVLSSKNSLYIITQFCKNGDLKEMMKRKKFKEDEVFEIMKQILSGFSELIRQKIVHRDLKPANILINQGVYKIGDFGFAKYVDNFGSQMLKSCVGSPIYMAPQILERSQYTTKCDIWSLGIIFYEMIFGYPPWKARDENELLRGIKTIPINSVLKKSSLSSKANEFLKRTLAYSEEERIGWAELFEMFNQKSQSKPVEVIENKIIHSSKQRTVRLASNNGTTSNTTPWNSTQQSTQNTISGSNQNLNNKYSSGSNNNIKYEALSPILAPEKKIAPYNNSQQVDNAIVQRQFCIYYHFYCVELFVNFTIMKQTLGSIELYSRLLYLLSLFVKYKSTYSISIMSLHYKTSKNMEELYRKMRIQHQSYEVIFNDIVAKLDKESILKKIKDQQSQLIGYGDIISQEKIEKLQNAMIKIAQEIAQMISDEVRKRAKSLKELIIVEILQFIVDVLYLGLGKVKALRELREDVKTEDEDLKDYVSKVINKLDRLTSNM